MIYPQISKDLGNFNDQNYPKFKQKNFIWSIMQLKWMIRYVLYSQSIDTTDISWYDTEPYLWHWPTVKVIDDDSYQLFCRSASVYPGASLGKIWRRNGLKVNRSLWTCKRANSLTHCLWHLSELAWLCTQGILAPNKWHVRSNYVLCSSLCGG